MTTSTNEQFIAEGEILASDAAAWALSQGISASQITLSSDGNASLPVFDQAGALTGFEVGKVSSLWQSFSELASLKSVELSHPISTVMQSPAAILKLANNGQLRKGGDVDIVLFEPDSFTIHSVFAKGQLMIDGGEVVVRGRFE